MNPVVIILEELIKTARHSKTCTTSTFDNRKLHHQECQCGLARALKNAEKAVKQMRAGEEVTAEQPERKRTEPLPVPVITRYGHSDVHPRVQQLEREVQRLTADIELYKTYNESDAYKQVKIMKLVVEETTAVAAKIKHALEVLIKAAENKDSLWVKLKGYRLPWMDLMAVPALKINLGQTFLETMKAFADKNNWDVCGAGLLFKPTKEPWKLAQVTLGTGELDKMFEIAQDDSDQQYKSYAADAKARGEEIIPFTTWYRKNVMKKEFDYQLQTKL